MQSVSLVITHLDMFFSYCSMTGITQWRVSIRLRVWHQILYSSNTKKIPNTENSSKIDGVTMIRKIKYLAFFLLGLFLLHFLILLILSGDVECNPGPGTGNTV